MQELENVHIFNFAFTIVMLHVQRIDVSRLYHVSILWVITIVSGPVQSFIIGAFPGEV